MLVKKITYQFNYLIDSSTQVSLLPSYVVCFIISVAWLVGWALILEYAIGSSAVARGISPNLVITFWSSTSIVQFLPSISTCVFTFKNRYIHQNCVTLHLSFYFYLNFFYALILKGYWLKYMFHKSKIFSNVCDNSYREANVIILFFTINITYTCDLYVTAGNNAVKFILIILPFPFFSLGKKVKSLFSAYIA